MKTLHGHLTGFCHGPNSSGLVLHVTYSDVKTVGHFLGQGVQSIFHSNFIGTMEFHGSLYPFSLKLRIKAEYLFPVTFWSCLAIYKQKGFPSRRPTKQNFSTFFGGGTSHWSYVSMWHAYNTGRAGCLHCATAVNPLQILNVLDTWLRIFHISFGTHTIFKLSVWPTFLEKYWMP